MSALVLKLRSLPVLFGRGLLLRLAVSFLVGCAAFWFVTVLGPRFMAPGGDFVFWAVRAARDLLAGRDPYAYPFHAGAIPYPLPAAFVGLPFVKLEAGLAGALFMALSSTLLAFGLTRQGKYWRLLVFLSYPYLEALETVQWSPLVMSLALFPDLLPLALAKPQVGLPAAVYHKPTRRGLILSGLVLLASLAVYPLWPVRWLSQVGPFGGYVPILLPFGFFLSLAALRISRPSGRLLLAMSILPRRAFYDSLLLWLIPEHWVEMLVLNLASFLALGLVLPDRRAYHLLVYYTALFLVLRPASWLVRRFREPSREVV